MRCTSSFAGPNQLPLNEADPLPLKYRLGVLRREGFGMIQTFCIESQAVKGDRVQYMRLIPRYPPDYRREKVFCFIYFCSGYFLSLPYTAIFCTLSY